MTHWPDFDEGQIEAVSRVLRSGKVNYWTGQEARLFEQEFAEACNSRYAVALANGTAALELALHVLDVGPGDEVVVTPRSFVASVSCVVLRGARPIFADVDPISQNVTADSIRKVLSGRTRAIIAVHLAGWPCDMDPILELARAHGLWVIEDCAQAHGASYKGRPVGSLGDVAAFSFCQDKIITTGGEGGMLVTDDEALWKEAWAYKDHGKSYDAVYNGAHQAGFRWLHESFGTNWRLTEMQAAIGRAQLRHLPEWLERRRRNAATLTACFRNISGLRVTEPPDHIGHAYYRYYAFVRPERLDKGWNRDRIMAAIADRGVPCASGACPEIYLERAFRMNRLGPVQRLNMACQLGKTSLAFLVDPTLTPERIEETCRAVETVFSSAERRFTVAVASRRHRAPARRSDGHHPPSNGSRLQGATSE